MPGGEARTVAELGNGWKHEHSHRARAAARATVSQARPVTSSSSRRACHQFTSAPKTITFAIR